MRTFSQLPATEWVQAYVRYFSVGLIPELAEAPFHSNEAPLLSSGLT
jgi:hypothetical protein